ncbi:hypothetical protein BROUX41_005504 [Berkeleyomyces rouxiae]|uniref:uncharacterized protein n=1 Tax=Berkeleyomyces rouxiae TaxID=2035830 RepID=UPI003B82B382
MQSSLSAPFSVAPSSALPNSASSSRSINRGHRPADLCVFSQVSPTYNQVDHSAGLLPQGVFNDFKCPFPSTASFDSSYQPYEAVTKPTLTPGSLESYSPPVLSVNRDMMHCQSQYRHRQHSEGLGPSHHHLTTPPSSTLWSYSEQPATSQSSPSLRAQAQPQPQPSVTGSQFGNNFIFTGIGATEPHISDFAMIMDGEEPPSSANSFQHATQQQQSQYDCTTVMQPPIDMDMMMYTQLHQPPTSQLSVSVPSPTPPTRSARDKSMVSTLSMSHTNRVTKKTSAKMRAATRYSPAGHAADSPSSSGTSSKPPTRRRSTADVFVEPLVFKDGTPEEDRYLLELRRKHDNLCGTFMWNQITEDFFQRFDRELTKPCLQMRLTRAKTKYLVWPESEKELLLQAYAQDEKDRYARILRGLQKLGGGTYMAWSAPNIEAMLVEMGAEAVYVDPETDLRSRLMPSAKARSQTGDKGKADLVDFYRQHTNQQRRNQPLGDTDITRLLDEIENIRGEEVFSKDLDSV